VTIATIMSKMQVVDNELDVSVGGADETRCLSALDMAQDQFETILANHPDTLGTTSTVTTTAQGETSDWPTTLLRLDTMWMMNLQVLPPTPQWQIDVIQDVGGQSMATPYPWLSGMVGYSPQGYGAPTAAYTNRQSFFWAPIPNEVYTIRVYGLHSKTDITSRSQTFQYPDQVANPLAVYAVRLMEMGIDDPSDELKALADEMFAPVINMLRKPTRQRPQSRQYTRMHTT